MKNVGKKVLVAYYRGCQQIITDISPKKSKNKSKNGKKQDAPPQKN